MIRLCAFADEAGNELDEQINALKSNKISLLELRSISGKNILDFSMDEAKNYAKILKDEGIDVWSIGSPIGKVDIWINFNEYLDKVKHVLDLADIFEAKRVRAFSFFKAYNEREKVFDYMNKIADIAKDRNICFCHENEKEVFGDTLERVKDIIDNVKGWKFILDPANFVQVNEDIDNVLSSINSYIEYYHIKDVINQTGELVPAGYGDGKIERIVSSISGDKVLTLEPHLMSFDAYGAIDKTPLKTRFKFNNNVESFNFAVDSLKKLLNKCGYQEKNGCFVN